ncbi:MAG: DUF4268 domain-containing protein [Flavobacteriaceae bacterium]|nr:DUF4268 domain-containing protein [Flavobacteriaceae bacterium]MCY4267296.1 DUF4268 domain-containing protein [Flavobacteriaceae bacterium]MCY4298479.1 DUF4268 domain-containing protein [Flavobacteriaceae bacterium]
MKELGEKKSVCLNEIWKTEPKFTEWLSDQDNFEILAETVGFDIENIENIQTEKTTGQFYVDIVADISNSEENISKIIIENQLKRTDHDHLGKLLTYASAFDACIIIWIVKETTEDHQNAIKWFNKHMPDSISFFLVKIGLCQIDDSKPAPEFTILEQPNHWSKTMDSKLSETKLKHLQFWQNFNDYASQTKTKLKIRKSPRAQHWFSITIPGDRKSHLAFIRDSKKNEIRVHIYIKNDQELYRHLEENKTRFIEKVESEVHWLPLKDKKASKIECKKIVDIDDESKQKEHFDWLLKVGEQLSGVYHETKNP